MDKTILRGTQFASMIFCISYFYELTLLEIRESF